MQLFYVRSKESKNGKHKEKEVMANSREHANQIATDLKNEFTPDEKYTQLLNRKH